MWRVYFTDIHSPHIIKSNYYEVFMVIRREDIEKMREL